MSVETAPAESYCPRRADRQPPPQLCISLLRISVLKFLLPANPVTSEAPTLGSIHTPERLLLFEIKDLAAFCIKDLCHNFNVRL